MNFTRHAATIPDEVVAAARKRYPDFSLLQHKSQVTVSVRGTRHTGTLQGYRYGMDIEGKTFLAASVSLPNSIKEHEVPPDAVTAYRSEFRIVLSLPLGYSAICIPGTRTDHSIQYQVRYGTEIRGVLRFRLHQKTYDWMPRKGDAMNNISRPEEIPY